MLSSVLLVVSFFRLVLLLFSIWLWIFIFPQCSLEIFFHLFSASPSWRPILDSPLRVNVALWALTRTITLNITYFLAHNFLSFDFVSVHFGAIFSHVEYSNVQKIFIFSSSWCCCCCCCYCCMYGTSHFCMCFSRMIFALGYFVVHFLFQHILSSW